MAASQSTGKGMQSERTVRSEPQRDWNSFSPTTTIPKDVEETILSPTEETRSSRETTETEKFIQERETARAPSSQQQLPRRRGRPRKNEEIMKAKIPEGPRIGLAAGELLRRVIQLEPAGKSSRNAGSEQGKRMSMGENEEAPSQQLKQAKLAIAELYQENRELRRQLATKTAEASAAQSHGGNMAWLKRNLREVHNVIVQLREVKRLAEERHTEHPRECRAAEKEICVALASAQKEKV
jgi:hypothetical protein